MLVREVADGRIVAYRNRDVALSIRETYPKARANGLLCLYRPLSAMRRKLKALISRE
jgi:hypothetical protein